MFGSMIISFGKTLTYTNFQKLLVKLRTLLRHWNPLRHS